MASDTRPVETKDAYVSEEAIVYCFSFADEPAVTGGATLSGPTAAVENTRITAGVAQVNGVDFLYYAEDSVTVLGTVPANKGVKVPLTFNSKGSCEVTIKVVCSDGQKPERKVRFRIM
jgi:hypothetical protein